MKTVVDSIRKCGWRKPGGLYIRTEPGFWPQCCRFPKPLEICPCCGAGVKYCRGWTWINPRQLFGEIYCTRPAPNHCPLVILPEKSGLLWIGKQFYQPDEWLEESQRLGVSRRIHTLPHQFKANQTWVFVASVHGIRNRDNTCSPAIFHAFKPTAVEYVAKGDETPEELESLEKRGITPVLVKREGELPLNENTP